MLIIVQKSEIHNLLFFVLILFVSIYCYKFLKHMDASGFFNSKFVKQAQYTLWSRRNENVITQKTETGTKLTHTSLFLTTPKLFNYTKKNRF